MKKILNHTILLLITGIAIACGGKTKDKNTEGQTTTAEVALYDQVMAIHDEVMPKMGDIMRLKSELHKELDSIRKDQPSDKERLETIKQTINDLEEADEAMMQWMRNFQPQDTVENQEKVMKYYNQQKEAIQKVKVQMLSAIKDARKVIEK